MNGDPLIPESKNLNLAGCCYFLNERNLRQTW